MGEAGPNIREVASHNQPSVSPSLGMDISMFAGLEGSALTASHETLYSVWESPFALRIIGSTPKFTLKWFGPKCLVCLVPLACLQRYISLTMGIGSRMLFEVLQMDRTTLFWGLPFPKITLPAVDSSILGGETY